MKRLLCSLLLMMFCIGLCACAKTETPPLTDDSVSGSDSGSASDPVSADSATDPQTGTSSVAADPEEILASSPHLVGLTDQKNSRLIVCDLAVEDWSEGKQIVWSFTDERCTYAAGIKFRHSEVWGGDVVIFCGPRGAGIVSYEKKQLLYFTTYVGSNPHSVELLPDGNLVVASSTDNDVRIFAASTGETKPSQSVVVSNAHGALWDPEYDVLWLSGGSNVLGYLIGGTSAAPKLVPRSDLKYKSPDSGLHDLAAVYGNTELLWLTCSKGVYQMNKETGECSNRYPGSAKTGTLTYTPGVGNFPDGTIAYVVPNKCFEEWNTDEVSFYVPTTSNRGKAYTRKVTSDAYYKLRVWIADYQ